jgi:plasmid segregation protein ParM
LEKISIAVDGGHSMFKVRAELLSQSSPGLSFQIPTIVMPAISLSNERTRQLAEHETVDLHGQKYFFGETALRQGRSEVYTGQHVNWIESVQHDVLMLGAWRKVMQALGNGPARVHLVLGLPAKYVAAQRDVLRRRISDLLTPRLGPGQTLRILVQSQADAPLQWLSIQNDGTLNSERDLDNEAWGVIEIGHFTTDFALSDRGVMLEYAAVSGPGMGLVYDAMASAMAREKLPTTLDVIELAVKSGEIKIYGNRLDVRHLLESAASGFESAVLDEADRVFQQKAALLDGIIVGGGGAKFLYEKLRKKFPNAICCDDPRMMVADGFCRLGLMSLRNS